MKALGYGEAPVGDYAIGEFSPRDVVFWYNLYPQRESKDGYWDYYCKNPDTGRSKIAFHSGNTSLGCITVFNVTCAKKMKELITKDDLGHRNVSVYGLTTSGIPIYRELLCACYAYTSISLFEVRLE